MAITTYDQREKWKANRRAKYKADADYRARVNARSKRFQAANRDEINKRRREKFASDPQHRERVQASKRGRDQRGYNLRFLYGITEADYNEMFRQQGGLCGICAQRAEENLCVDHCHKTGRVRALLCRKCNTGLGCYRDSPALMQLAAYYVRAHHVD